MQTARAMVYLAIAAVLAVSAIAETVSSSSPLDSAKQLISEAKFSDAIPLLEGIVASDPASAPQALKMIGDCYKAQQKWAKAIEAFEKLLADYPNSVAPDRGVKAWIMDCYLANGDLEKCLSLRKEMLNQYRGDEWKLYYIVGKRFVLRHEYAKAIPELKQAINLGTAIVGEPDLADASYRLLHCYVVEKQWESAEELGPKLIKAYRDVAYKFHMEMGKCYQGQGKFDPAIEAMETAANLAPKQDYYNFKIIQKALLDCYDRVAGLDKAVDLAKKLVEDYPAEPAWKWELGRRYVVKGEYERAVPLFESVLASSTRRWEIRSSEIYLGQCLANLGKGKEALKRIDDYYEGKPEMWDEYLLAKAAVLFSGLKDDEGGVATLKQLLAEVASGKKSSFLMTVRELMYRALERMGKLTEAAVTLEEMAAESKDVAWLCRAGDDYFKAGNYKEARRVYDSVVDASVVTDEIRAKCMYGMAQCYRETGLKDAARRLVAKVIERYPDTEAAMRAQWSLYLWYPESQYSEEGYYRLYTMMNRSENRTERKQVVQAYLQHYPDGKYATKFKEWLETIEKAEQTVNDPR